MRTSKEIIEKSIFDIGKKRIYRACLPALLFMVSAVLTHAAGVFEAASQQEWLKGKAENLFITGEGYLATAPACETMMEYEEEELILCGASRRGYFYLGTSPDGKIYKADEKGNSEIFFDSPEQMILSLHYDAKEDVFYAGTSPGGLIYRINARGIAETFCRTEKQYVWDLLKDEKENLIAAVGTPGDILKIDREGRAEALYESPAEHIVNLIRQGDEIYAGASEPALLIRINRDDSISTLYQTSEHAEVGQLEFIGDILYFTLINSAQDTDASNFQGNATLMKEVEPDLFLPLAEFEHKVAYSLEHHAGALWIGAGDEGAIYRVDPVTGEFDRWGSAFERPATLLHSLNSGLFLGISQPATLYKFTKKISPEGSWTSDPMDATLPARWGHVNFITFDDPDVHFEVSTRTGFVSEPDETWNEWRALNKDQNVQSEPGRFLQLKIETSKAKKPEPVISSFSVNYRIPNRAPKIESVKVFAPQMGVFEKMPQLPTKRFAQMLPDGVRIEYQFFDQNAGGLSKGRWTAVKGYRTVKWTAEDPDRDELLYKIEYKSKRDATWILLEEKWENDYYTLDTSPLADGDYQIRITADDVKNNTLQEYKTHMKLSETFIVDHTAPEITDYSLKKKNDSEWIFKAKATDELSPVTEAEIYLPELDWIKAEPEDKILDEKQETFKLVLPAFLMSNQPAVSFKASDDQENSKIIRVVP